MFAPVRPRKEQFMHTERSDRVKAEMQRLLGKKAEALDKAAAASADGGVAVKTGNDKWMDVHSKLAEQSAMSVLCTAVLQCNVCCAL